MESMKKLERRAFIIIAMFALSLAFWGFMSWVFNIFQPPFNDHFNLAVSLSDYARGIR